MLDVSHPVAGCDTLVLLAHGGGPAELLPAGRAWDAEHDGLLARALARLAFDGRRGELAHVTLPGPGPGPSLVTVAGIGDGPPRAADVRRALGAAARSAPAGTLGAPDLERLDPAARLAGAIGLLGGALAAGAVDGSAPALERIALGAADARELAHAESIARAVQLVRRWSNAPPSALGPAELAAQAAEAARAAGLEAELVEGDALARLGCGALRAVGGGSQRPPLLLRLRHRHPAPLARIALVGKGVTFDSGGLCLKPAGQLPAMKHDMAGAATAIAATIAVAEAGWPLHVETLVPLVENMTGGGSYRPGDVVTHPDGSTTEIVNTDAEGRLVVADALALLGREEPFDAIVDVATIEDGWLAVGPRTIPLYATDDALAGELAAAAAAVGEPCWRLPLFPEYEDELSSRIADRRHCGRSPHRPTPMLAALYLRRFLPAGTAWAHLDVALAVATAEPWGDAEAGATGMPTATLVDWLRRRAGAEDAGVC